MGTKHIGGHDLDLSGSRDVIGHVTSGLGMGHFLWTQVSISNGFRDIPPQTSCASLRMRVSRDIYPYANFKYISPPLCLFTMSLSLSSDEE